MPARSPKAKTKTEPKIRTAAKPAPKKPIPTVTDPGPGDGLVRCGWSLSTAQYRAYHDEEWGVPMRDPLQLFHLLMLEGMQAGLTWRLILERRAQLQRAFLNFDPIRLSRTREGKVDAIMLAPGVIKHRGKIAAVISNAREYVRLTAELAPCGEDFSHFLWQFVDGEPVVNQFGSMQEVPAQTDASVAMSKGLKREGFKFVGPTICYAFMQSAGMVNDHVTSCFRYTQVGETIPGKTERANHGVGRRK